MFQMTLWGKKDNPPPPTPSEEGGDCHLVKRNIIEPLSKKGPMRLQNNKILLMSKLVYESVRAFHKKRERVLEKYLDPRTVDGIEKDKGMKFHDDLIRRMPGALYDIWVYSFEWRKLSRVPGLEKSHRRYRKTLFHVINELKVSTEPIPPYTSDNELPDKLNDSLKCVNLVIKLGGLNYRWRGQAHYIRECRKLLRKVAKKWYNSPEQPTLDDCNEKRKLKQLREVQDHEYMMELADHWGQRHRRCL